MTKPGNDVLSADSVTEGTQPTTVDATNEPTTRDDVTESITKGMIIVDELQSRSLPLRLAKDSQR